MVINITARDHYLLKATVELIVVQMQSAQEITSGTSTAEWRGRARLPTKDCDAGRGWELLYLIVQQAIFMTAQRLIHIPGRRMSYLVMEKPLNIAINEQQWRIQFMVLSLDEMG